MVWDKLNCEGEKKTGGMGLGLENNGNKVKQKLCIVGTLVHYHDDACLWKNIHIKHGQSC